MSDWIEHDGKKYYEESYIVLANRLAKCAMEGRMCPLCAQERAIGAKALAIRGERLEDHDGKPIEVRDA